MTWLPGQKRLLLIIDMSKRRTRNACHSYSLLSIHNPLKKMSLCRKECLKRRQKERFSKAPRSRKKVGFALCNKLINTFSLIYIRISLRNNRFEIMYAYRQLCLCHDLNLVKCDFITHTYSFARGRSLSTGHMTLKYKF